MKTYWVDPESDRLAGEHSRIGYPAVNLVPVDHLGQSFAPDVFSVYKKTVKSIEIRFVDRLDQHRVLREFGGIRYSIIHNDPEELPDPIRKLHNTRVLSG